MKRKSLTLLLVVLGACGSSPAPGPETAVTEMPTETAPAETAVDAASGGLLADLDMMCAAPTDADVQNVNSAERTQVLAQHIDENLQSDEGRNVFAALALAADKETLLINVRQEAGHVGDCELQRVLAELGPEEASTDEAVVGEAVVGEAVVGEATEAGTPDLNIRGSLSRDEIQAVVRRHLNQVRYCYERRLAQDPTLRGRTVVRFVISAEGRVQGAIVQSAFDPEVDSCLTRVMARWEFPAPSGGGIVIVSYPFVFQPG